MNTYNVVFEYVGDNPSKGNMTWLSFASEDDFKRCYTEEMQKVLVIKEKGISKNRCRDLCLQTPQNCRVAMAIEESTDQSGHVDIKALEREVAELNFVEKLLQSSENR